MRETPSALSERQYRVLRAWFLTAMAITLLLGIVIGVMIGAAL